MLPALRLLVPLMMLHKSPQKLNRRPAAAQAGSASAALMSPSASKLASEKGIDPASLQGSGKGGRITKSDIMNASPAVAAGAAAPLDNSPREERVKMTRLRKTIAQRLKESQNTAAILSTFNEVDLSEVMRIRKEYQERFMEKHGVKLGFMSFFIKAAVSALKELPAVNAEIDGDDIVYKNHYDIGVAVGTDQGLVVPVLRDADRLSFAGIEKGVAELGKKARAGQLTMQDMSGGTFSITNGGTYGSLLSTPIINPPQSGIMGMHNIVERPMAVNGQVEIRPMMYIALSYDHRIIDGKEAVTFLVRVKQLIENPEKLLFDI
jgi:2-oxoglutarate dehydrogenase E2 component (dihydrolipoamide succinyltransferase)